MVHVADRRQARAAPEGGPFDQGDGQGGDVGQRLEHGADRQGVVALVRLGPVGEDLDPIQVQPGAEGPALAPQENDPHVVGAVQRLKRLPQGHDGLPVEGIGLVRPVQGDEGDAFGRGFQAHQVGDVLGDDVFDKRIGDRIGHVCAFLGFVAPAVQRNRLSLVISNAQR
jgi:hypothetical protein